MAARLASVGDPVSFLDDLASRQPAPGGGAAAAMSAALAAGLVAMVARSSSRLDDADELARVADDWRARAVALADEDGRTYAEVLAAAPHRDADPGRFHAAVAAANRAPGEVVALADRISATGVRLVDEGARRLRGDAIVAVVLADAAATAALALLELNTTYGGLAEDDVEVARDLRAACRSRAEQVRDGR